MSLNKNWSFTFFKSITLYYNDIQDHLLGKTWLNDNIITFYYLFLEESFKNKNFIFLNPSISFLSLMCEYDDILEQVKDFELEKKDLIFIPINDCQDISQGGGSHWSLLVYDRRKKKYLYLDSAGKYNYQTSIKILQKLSKIIDPDAQEVDFEQIDVPSQNNSYDCGIFTLCYTENVAENEGNVSKINEVKEKVGGMRKKIYDLILKMSKTL